MHDIIITPYFISFLVSLAANKTSQLFEKDAIEEINEIVEKALKRLIINNNIREREKSKYIDFIKKYHLINSDNLTEIEKQKYNKFVIEFNNLLPNYPKAFNLIHLLKQNIQIDNQGKILTRIDDIISLLQNQNNKIKKEIGAKPIPPEIFLGDDRENALTSINKKLKEKSILLLSGEGGIGKSTIAFRYYYKFYNDYNYLIYIVSESGIDEALIPLKEELKIEFDKDADKAKQLEKIVKEISALQKPVLLVIDNVNMLNDLENNFVTLRKLIPVHILITSRIREYEPIEVFPIEILSEEDAVKLFEYHYKQQLQGNEKSLFMKILEAIETNTLVIELMAKNLSKFNNELEENYPLDKLLKDIQSKGILSLQKSKDIKTDYYFEKTTPEKIILAMYDIAELNEEKKNILSVLAHLSLTPIPYSDLKVFLPDVNELNIQLKELAKEGWCIFDKESRSFKINQIISEVVKKKTEDYSRLFKVVKLFISNLENTNDVEILKNYKWIPYGTTIIKNLITRPKIQENMPYKFEIARLAFIIANVHQKINEFPQALEKYEEALKIRRELAEKNPKTYLPYVATTLNNLANLHSAKNEFPQALEKYEEALKIYRELAEESPERYEIDYAKTLIIGVIYFKKDKENLEKAKNILIKYKHVPFANKLTDLINELVKENNG